MPTPPVVLVSFNRPAFTARTLDRIREVKPEQLFLVCDGPRADHPSDQQRCAEVREVLEHVDWPCEVHRRYSEVNGGFDKTIELGLDWVFEHVPHAVVLEDDCVPDPSFLEFCDELLHRYADDPRVAQIAGSNLLADPRLFDGRSYDFSTYAACWGWATWRRAWQEHRAFFPRTHQPAAGDPTGAIPVRIGEVDLGGLVTGGGRRYFAEVARNRDPRGFAWDSQWWLTVAARRWVCVSPKVNMVANVGFGDDATHTQSTRVMPGAEPTPFPLVHPPVVEPNVELSRALEHVLVRANGRLARRARQLMPGWLRPVARAVATGPAAAWVMHQLSRLVSVVRRGRSG